MGAKLIELDKSKGKKGSHGGPPSDNTILTVTMKMTVADARTFLAEVTGGEPVSPDNIARTVALAVLRALNSGGGGKKDKKGKKGGKSKGSKGSGGGAGKGGGKLVGGLKHS